MPRSASSFIHLAQSASPTTAPARQPSLGLNGVGPCIAVGILLFLVVGGGIFWRLLKMDLREQRARREAEGLASTAAAPAGGERSLSISAAVIAVLAVGALVVGVVMLALIMTKR
ncbi:MAG TPA: hypothetical protein VF796_17855 [Humisphaera sp.]